MIDSADIAERFSSIHSELLDVLTTKTGHAPRKEPWDYTGGTGGGLTAAFEGDVIEKGGVNYSHVQGELSDTMAGRMELGADRTFVATGISVVLHPRNPFVPTVHMNVRYLERGDKAWFGGGMDLTPCYPFEEDIVQFHRVLKETCDRHNPSYYPEFKAWCDRYFFIKHRNEPRGVGGIFFDYLTEDPDSEFSFTCDVARAFPKAYIPILEKRRHASYSNRHREFQLIRRGRYVEFNLVYDRGTSFGLETGGRTEAVLISLPPLAAWAYDFKPDPGTQEARLLEILTPRDWANQDPSPSPEPGEDGR